MEQWTTLISDVGFPILVTLYLLHRLERKLDGVIKAVGALQTLKECPLKNKKSS
ncbi:YvrJ family protein [Halalkalibacterium ligniniphilum]|uniref:YvrJ family protein n=1 Tax=Halalkalibacterium ligniniphilum TaxID=1134413 RepID=UPI000346F36F|nr:YvrJ family protein [Halalkalibacterium ligniniphilum]